MAQKLTINTNPNPYDTPSKEFLSKMSNKYQQEIKELSYKAKQAREDAYKKLNEDKEKSKNLTQDQIKERQSLIDEQITKLYSTPQPKPPIEVGKSGTLPAEHKNKLAFIFIGDDIKGESDKNNLINSPKISFVVGGGLESAIGEAPKTIDPRTNKIIGVSSEFHITSLTDINVEGILPISSLSNRSAIIAKSDVIDLSAREVVVIRSLGEAYGSKGQRVMSPGGVHIISGQNTNKVKINEPQPMVLGKNLNDTLVKILEEVGNLNSAIININTDILALKISLMAHFHIATGPAAPTSPSADLVASVAPTIPTKTVMNISNAYSTLINLEMIKANNLTSLSPQRFVSDFNKVN